MPKLTVPLLGSFVSRDATNTSLFGSSQKDQYFKNAHFSINQNSVTGKTSFAVMARQNYNEGTIPSSSSGAGTAVQTWRALNDIRVSAFGNTNSTVYVTSTSVGTITGQAKFIDETTVNDTSTMLISSTDNTGWYLPSDSFSATSYTGDTHSNTTVDNIASTAGMYSGQAISGSGIPAGTRILSVDSANQITLTAAATATAAGVALTKTPIAKILDADFPGNASMVITGRFAPIDGYAAIMTTSGRIYTPAVNSVSSWVANDYIVAQEYPDPGIGAIRMRNCVIAASKTSIEFFTNAGNIAGSPLNRVQHLVINIGVPNQYALCEWNGAVAFIGNKGGVFGVYLLRGSDIEKISTQQLDDWLKDNGVGVTTARLNPLTCYGDPYLALSLTSGANNVMVFHPISKTWHPWELTYSLTQSVANYDQTAVSAIYVGDDSQKCLVVSSAPVMATAEFQTVPLDDSGQRIWVKSIRLIGDKAASTMNVGVTVNFEDGSKVGPTRTVDVSKSSQIARLLGMGRRPQVKITGLSGVSERPHRLQALVVEMETDVV
jgi:hypothetical protein